MTTRMRRALATAGAALIACGALAGTAAADTLYPTDPRARDFAEGTRGWQDQSRECALLGAIPIPIPLVCSTVNEHAPGDGNPPGSLKSRFQPIANLGGQLFQGTAVWRSPTFTVTEASPGALQRAALSFERKATVQALIDQGGEAVTKVELVNVTNTPEQRKVLLEETLTEENSTFDRPRAVEVLPPDIRAGQTYVLEFTTTFTSTAIQVAQGEIAAYYDNIQLRVIDGTDTLNVAPTVTTLLATDITDTTATLNAIVSPKGLPTTASFHIREAGTDNFREVPYGDVGEGTNAVRINQQATGLQPCKTYEYRGFARNAQGPGEGALSVFQTNCAPTAVTLPAAPVSATAAGLNSSVNPNGPETFYRYQLSLSADFRPETTLTTEERSAGSGRDTKQPLNEPLNGLRPQTTYFYRVLARNSLGDATGSTVHFTTPPQSAPGPPGAPGPRGPAGPPGVRGQAGVDPESEPRFLRIRQALVSVGLRGRRAGQIRLRIFCSALTGRSCAGTVKLRTIGKINPSSRPGVRKRARRVTFATFEYQLAQGKSGVAIAQMTPEKVDLLRLRRGLGRTIGISISVQVTGASGNRQTIVRQGRLRLVSSPR